MGVLPTITIGILAAAGRYYVGYEINEEYVSLANRRINEFKSLPAQQVIFDKWAGN